MAKGNPKESSDKRVGIWIRVSTEDQARGDSPEHHEQRARYYAEAKGWNVVEVYHLEGVSGKDVNDHPEARRMTEDVKRGHIKALIFSKLARLARSTRDLLDFADFFQEYDADLVSLAENIDTSSAAGRLFFTIVAAMAEWERAEIAERVAASVPVRARNGKPLGGQASYGYQWVNGELAINPDEAPVRKLMYDLFLEHGRKTLVAQRLNEMGYRTRKGGMWSDTSIDRLLRDPTAKGVRRANYTKSLGNGKQWELKPESEWVLVKVPQLVDEDNWNACNKMLDNQKAGKTRRPARRPVHIFSGVTLCSQCQESMRIPTGSKKYTCLKCRFKIPVEDLEAVFLSELEHFFQSETEIQQLVSDAELGISQLTEQLESLRREQPKVQHQLDELFRLHHEGQIPTDGFGQRYQPLQDRLEQIKSEIPNTEGELAYLTTNLLSADKAMIDAKVLMRRWKTLDRDGRRQIVESITDSILVGEDGIEINLSYLPFSHELTASSQRNHRDSARTPTGTG